MERLDRRTFVGRSAGYLLGGTLAAVPHRSSAAEVLRLATIPLDAGAEVYYALEMGFLRDAGIDAQIQSIPNGAAIAAAVASNAIDVGFSNLISLGEAYKRNVPFTVIAPGSLWSVKAPTTVLMVPKDSTVRRARDLNGKTIGVNGLKNILQYGAQAWIDRNGGDSSTVHRGSQSRGADLGARARRGRTQPADRLLFHHESLGGRSSQHGRPFCARHRKDGCLGQRPSAAERSNLDEIQ